MECAVSNHGCSPSVKRLKLNALEQTVTFGYLLSFVPFGELDILDWWNVFKSKVDKCVVPFATTNDGGLICFDYRNGHTPSIVFWDNVHLHYLCDSFATLLEMLF